ncbi:alpha/beta hydrolase [Paenibacillus endoradicis]|uniref:alpha/beta hydrolase n=1 Tax=Paenibacillus endoradicis TaxID=2972487 RepID=UPI002158E9B6|nr:alpha/beta hydrolase-fold protein [Paenibacillus endoradicis]MCR8655906.1 alpha/beta hydrolase-fold protein [Paenibacillus endoradicis]MCR8658232.1 alpha/beta hydrolase-fold protein [Paenibacillus endoradicis]
MVRINVTGLPDKYLWSVIEERQGFVQEITYMVNNYINHSRQLVTSGNIDMDEAGREIVTGDALMKKCNIYLPAGYDPNDVAVRYNVLYLLHGVGGNQYEWLRSNGKVKERFIICNIFDNLIANGEIEPLIIVFPNGRSAYDWTDSSFNSEGTNMLGFYYFDYELRHDLIPFIELNYNTYADIMNTSHEGIKYNRTRRAIAGLSMGGMQALNLILGGYRYDSTLFTGTKSHWNNGLDKTVLAPGLIDLFDYVGAFSNAPTSSDGKILGSSLASCAFKLQLLYTTCGSEDGVANNSFLNSIDQLIHEAGDDLAHYYEIIIKDGIHDFNVWNNGAYNFSRLAFRNFDDQLMSNVVKKVL